MLFKRHPKSDMYLIMLRNRVNKEIQKFGISFINIHSQSRLEGNNNPYLLFPSRTERSLPRLIN